MTKYWINWIYKTCNIISAGLFYPGDMGLKGFNFEPYKGQTLISFSCNIESAKILNDKCNHFKYMHLTGYAIVSLYKML